jgi:hypothetical protein
MLIIGISGQAKSGKDTAADFLVKNNGFVKVAFADPIKRMTAIAYPKMTRDHLWGSSEMRNFQIVDYPRLHGPWIEVEGKKRCACCNVLVDFYDDSQCYLTARYALQTLGTEWGRRCYPNTWVDLAMYDARCLLERNGILRSVHYSYTPWDGLMMSNVPTGPKPKGVAISDVRWPDGNEGKAIKENGGFLVQMLRGTGLEGAAGQHESEKNMGVASTIYDRQIPNDTMSLDELEEFMGKVAATFDRQGRRTK